MMRLLSTSAGEQTVVATVPWTRRTSIVIHAKRVYYHRNTYRREARGEMTVNIIFEERSLEQLCLEEVITVGVLEDSGGQERIRTTRVDSHS